MAQRTVLSMLKSAAEKFPQRQYVLRKTDEGWKGRTFSEAREEVQALGASLLNLGFSSGSTAAILAEGSPEWVISELATLSAGCISVPLSIRLLPEEIPFRLNHSESKAVFVSKNQLPKLLSVLDRIENRDLMIIYLDDDREFLEKSCRENGIDIGKRVFLFDELVRQGRELPEQLEQVRKIEEKAGEDAVVTISYTSGTTGNPKGIMLMHRNYYVNCMDSVEAFKVPETYQTLLILPCDHSFAHTVGLYAALFRGITLYFVDARGGQMGLLRNIPKNLLEAKPVFLLSVPALTANFMKKIINGVEEKGGLIEKIFKAGIEAGIRYYGDVYHKPPFLTRVMNFLPYKFADLLIFGKLRKMIFGEKFEFFVGGGALLEKRQQEFFRALGIPVFQGYGLTEAAPVISSNTHSDHKIGSSGRVMPNVECRIMNAEGAFLPQGEKGEIVVRGENVMKGYFKNEEATRETLKDGWLHTGDLGYFDEDGFLVVAGREKALLISADGEKYSPEEIEEAMMNSSPFVHQAVIWNDHQKYTSALIVPDVDAVKKFLAKNPSAGAEEVLGLYRELLQSFRTEKQFRNRFPAVWVPTTFQLLTEPFTEKNLLINSTGKMVRYKVIETHQELLEYMYTPEGSNHLNEKNLAACSQLFPLEAKAPEAV